MKAVASVVLLLLGSGLGTSQEAEKVLLRHHPRAGHPSRVHLSMRMEYSPGPGSTEVGIVVREEFQEQTPKGYVWKTTVESTSSKQEGDFAAVDLTSLRKYEGVTERFVMNSRGQILGKAPSSMIYYGEMLWFPEATVAVGESWEHPEFTRSSPFPLIFTLSKIIEEQGRRLAVVEAKADYRGGLKTPEPYVYWVNLADGLIVRFDGEGVDGRSGSPMKVKIHIERTYNSDSAASSGKSGG